MTSLLFILGDDSELISQVLLILRQIQVQSESSVGR